MGLEIERKFLLRNREWTAHVTRRQRIRQGYLSSGGPASVRVRLIDDRATLTVKTAISGVSRHEFEYGIPPVDAEAMINACTGSVIDKVRHSVPVGSLIWTIDVFEGDNAGLVIAEVELDSEHQALDIPSWAGEEVTLDRRYYNADLTLNPYRTWRGSETPRVPGATVPVGPLGRGVCVLVIR